MFWVGQSGTIDYDSKIAFTFSTHPRLVLLSSLGARIGMVGMQKALDVFSPQ
jgi:hypothetical protein